MKRQILKNTVYFGIFSILVFSTFEVFAMNGGGHGTQGGGWSSPSGMQGYMGDNPSSSFQHMDQYRNPHQNRGMDQDWNQRRHRDWNQRSYRDWNQRSYRDWNQRRYRDWNQRRNYDMDQRRDYFTK